jgi:hypothetical protein
MTGGTGRSSRYPPAAHGCSQPQQVQLPSKGTILESQGRGRSSRYPPAALTNLYKATNRNSAKNKREFTSEALNAALLPIGWRKKA